MKKQILKEASEANWPAKTFWPDADNGMTANRAWKKLHDILSAPGATIDSVKAEVEKLDKQIKDYDDAWDKYSAAFDAELKNMNASEIAPDAEGEEDDLGAEDGTVEAGCGDVGFTARLGDKTYEFEYEMDIIQRYIDMAEEKGLDLDELWVRIDNGNLTELSAASELKSADIDDLQNSTEVREDGIYRCRMFGDGVTDKRDLETLDDALGGNLWIKVRELDEVDPLDLDF